MIKTRTFKQIVDGNINGVWQSEEGDILKVCDGNISLQAISEGVNVDKLFTLQRPQLSFMEAIKHYDEGRIIESAITQNTFDYEGEKGKGRIRATVKEILGGWYLYE